ncbi:MAG: M56 family metallopeptidase [Thermoleophilia bacterium]
MRRLLDGRARPRTLALAYFAALLSVAGATLALLVALLLRYLPHSLMVRVGLACQMEDGCASPLPLWAGSTFSFLMGGVILGLVLFALIAACSQTNCSTRRCVDLSRTSALLQAPLSGDLDGRVLLVEDSAPVSYTIGFFRPRVVVSTGLLAGLDEDEVRAVLAHEEGHVVARDNLITLVAQTIAMTFAPLPGVRFAYAHLRRAQEHAADEFARERTGDGLLVASSLTKFARTLLRSRAASPASPVMAFAEGGDVGERIRGLLADSVVVTSKRRLVAAALAFVVLIAAFSGSALAFTGVTLASRSDCSTCHSLVAGATSSLAHDSCAVPTAAR